MTAPVPAGIVEAAARVVDAIFRSGKHCPHQGEVDPISDYDCPRCVGGAVLAVVLPMVADEIEALPLDSGHGWEFSAGTIRYRAANLVRSLAEGLGDE